jgi:hypothetical protein
MTVLMISFKARCVEFFQVVEMPLNMFPRIFSAGTFTLKFCETPSPKLNWELDRQILKNPLSTPNPV